MAALSFLGAAHSEAVAASKAVYAGPCVVVAMHLGFTGTAGNVKIRDGDGTGTILFDQDTPAADKSSIPVVLPLLTCKTACYVQVTNAVCNVSVQA